MSNNTLETIRQSVLDKVAEAIDDPKALFGYIQALEGVESIKIGVARSAMAQEKHGAKMEIIEYNRLRLQKRD